jgi:hypothetical protein
MVLMMICGKELWVPLDREIARQMATILAPFREWFGERFKLPFQSQRIVNWDVAGERLAASTEVIRKGAEGLRDEVHELTRWMEQEQIKRVCLELMAPMVREFTKAVAEMRQQGASEADIAVMLDKIEMDNRGTVEDAVLETIMSELRRVAQTPAAKTERPA